jgi:hypothetical protein
MNVLVARRTAVAMLASLLALGAGCAAQDDAPRSTTRDSAGIEIVENGTPDSLPRWQLSAAPTLVIGDGDSQPDQQLYRASSATRMLDSVIAVGNAGTNQVLLFGADGRRLAAFGRRGRGPGEFHGTIRVLSSDSTLIVEDLGRPRKLLRFGTDGSLLDERVLPGGARPPPGAWSDPATNGDGVAFMLGEKLPIGTAEAPPTRHPIHVVRFTYDGGGPDTIASYPGSELAYVDVGPQPAFGGGTASGPRAYAPLFAATTRLAGGGRTWRVVVGDQATAAYDVFHESGSLARRVRWLAGGRTPAPEDVEQAESRFLDRRASNRAGARRALDALPEPARTPVFGDIRVSRDDHVWIERYALPSEASAQWWIFSDSGRLVASIAIPTDLEILEIGSDYVLLRATGAFDVERIELRTVERNSLVPQ